MKKILLVVILLFSTKAYCQNINDIKRDVVNSCKESYDLFKPIEWSNYKLKNKKIPIEGDAPDSSLYKNIDKFFKGDTSKSNFNTVNSYPKSFYFSYIINKTDTFENIASNTIGRITLNKKRFNYITVNHITDNFDDTIYFNIKNNKIITNNNDTLIILDRAMLVEDLPKKVDYFINSYEIRLVYKALSKGGIVRIYSNTFVINYKLNGKLSSLYEKEED